MVQGNMSLSAGSKRMVPCPFGVCSGDQWRSHAVQVALATDCVGTPGRDEAKITSRNVTAPQEVVAKAAEGLSMWRGSSWTPLRQSEDASKQTNGAW